ncbi:MAG: ABC transporter permease [Acidobacteria bacterium]|nr:ABC transporter permease [Acidobacteriota bacterium]MCI0663310.1 ABC transporter permease [Acidobacteriota bacterium]
MKTLLRELIFPLVAVLAAFIIGGVIVLAIGDSPFEVYRILISSAFGLFDALGNFTYDNWGYTLFYATPLIFTGLAVAVAFKCGLLNIGVEGQLYVGAFAAAWIGISFTKLPGMVLVPMAIFAAIVAGAAWGAIPGLLKARFGSHEVINTIMLNFIAIGLVSYLTQNHYKVRGDPIMQTVPIAEQAHIARFRTLLAPFGLDFPQRIPLNISFLLALLACFLVWVFLWRTKWGYEIRAVGSNPSAAEYGGISVQRQIVLAMVVSGALAGMVGINEVLGYRYRYYHDFSPGYGFAGIAVALLGRNHPVGVLLAAILFGALNRGGLFVDIFTAKVSKDLVQVLQAIIILFVAMEVLFRSALARFIPALSKR